MIQTDSFRKLTDRLSDLSVRRHHEAYRDVPWDDDTMLVDAEDPRWTLPTWDPLGASTWYRDQSLGRRSAIGLHRAATFMKVGIDFEAGLQQGLLSFAATLPNRHPAFRYIYLEIAEEIQHSLLFQGFVDRSGFDPKVASGSLLATNQSTDLARELPVLFFVSVLGGEGPIDHIQRRVLESGQRIHPLLRAINWIHCQEEARHISFARAYLRQASRQLGQDDARRVAYQAPLVVRAMAGRMILVPDHLATHWGMPSDVCRSINDGDVCTRLVRAATATVGLACQAAGLVPRRIMPLWHHLGLT